MVLTKDELIASLQHEVRVLLHLASKVDPAKLEYRPTSKQRSLLELLQYLTIMAPIHIRGIKADPPQMPGSQAFDLDVWRHTWRTEETAAKAMNLEGPRTRSASNLGCSRSCWAPVPMPTSTPRSKCSEEGPVEARGSSTWCCATMLRTACSCSCI
jgi:hypothetical protein